MTEPRTVGKCTRVVDGVECGGTIKENVVTYNREGVIALLLGRKHAEGFVCEKCGDKTPLSAPESR